MSKKLTAIIVDDEEPARSYLRELLGAHDDINLIAECANGFEAVKVVSESKPDLVFLDIQMPKLDGFEVLELIGPGPAVVFVTAYDEYALRAFDVHAVDYLLKPFAAERFEEALDHVRRRLSEPRPAAIDLSAAARGPSRYLERIAVRHASSVYVVPVRKLDYAEAQEDYVGLKTEGKTYLKQQTISGLEKALDPARFVRIHRSYIVNIDRIARIEPYSKDSRIAVLTTSAQLPVSRTGYAKLRELLGQND